MHVKINRFNNEQCLRSDEEMFPLISRYLLTPLALSIYYLSSITNLLQPIQQISSSDAKLQISFNSLQTNSDIPTLQTTLLLMSKRIICGGHQDVCLQKRRLAQLRMRPRGQKAGRCTFHVIYFVGRWLFLLLNSTLYFFFGFGIKQICV